MKVCFVALYAYPLFRPAAQGLFGGSEVRTWLLATALGRFPEHVVSCIVFDHGQAPFERVGQVVLVPHSFYRVPQMPPAVPERHADASRLSHWWNTWRQRTARFRHGNIVINGYTISRRMMQVYADVAADVYCVCGVSNFAAEIVAYCQRVRKTFVLLAASDTDFSADYRQDSRGVNPYGSRADLCHYVIMTADRILTQTAEQAVLVRMRFGRDAMILRNPLDLSSRLRAVPVAEAQEKAALWIGKSDTVKQPEIMLRLAHALPWMCFVMLMNRVDPGIFDQIAGNKPPNVTLIEQMPFSEVELLFTQAVVLVNTSRFEGFPNAFLQAGKYRVPIVSLQVDPDGFIARYECGIVADGDLSRLQHGVAHMYTDASLRERCGNNLYTYVETHHRLEDKIHEFNQVVSELANNPGPICASRGWRRILRPNRWQG
jgi:glycosyltransferase involved in cell wall biosynthesis